jgi:hypothetical protein
MIVFGFGIALWYAMEPELGLFALLVWSGYASLVCGTALLIKDLRARFRI